jgi:hypothetical protein
LRNRQRLSEPIVNIEEKENTQAILCGVFERRDEVKKKETYFEKHVSNPTDEQKRQNHNDTIFKSKVGKHHNGQL